MGEFRDPSSSFGHQFLSRGGRGYAYDKARVREALANWRDTAPDRNEAERRIRQDGPLGAEPHQRVVWVAERAQKKVSALSAAERLKMTGPVQDLMQTPPATMKAMDDRVLEAMIGAAEEFLSVVFIARAAFVQQSVGRIADASTGAGIGTGFLVAPEVLMTNNHVLPDRAGASAFAVQFGYELDLGRRDLPGFKFRLEPTRLFITDRELDFTLVAVSRQSEEKQPLSAFGYLPLVGLQGKIYVGSPVNIIQHPGGERKKIVVRESILKLLPKAVDTVAHYTGDTKPGSSGSPVFSDDWEVVALHHSGVPELREDGRWEDVRGGPWNEATDPDMKWVKWVANEGIRVSRLVDRIKAHQPKLAGEERELIDSVIDVGLDAAHDDPFVIEAIRRADAARVPPASVGPTAPQAAALASETVTAQPAAAPPPPPAPPAGSVSVQIPLTITVSLGTPTAGGGSQPA